MYQGKRIGVVVPTYNEERFIEEVFNTMPGYVDRIYVVDDASTDGTSRIISEVVGQNGRSEVLTHKENRGVGAAIVTGYKEALIEGVDIIAVMAGDNQMDPAELPKLLAPLIADSADYVKGNRMSNSDHLHGMTYWRRFGNWLLKWLTRIASGNYKLTDPQNGYTAITRKALGLINLDDVYPGYGYCNDILVKLSVAGARIYEIPIPARYGEEKSKIRYSRYMPRVSLLLFKDFLWRLRVKYIYGKGMNLDFTLDKYRQLLETICRNGYSVTTVAEYLNNSDSGWKVIVLRHDVDRKPWKALQMARLEQKLGIKTSYYFRFNNKVFRPHLIKEIASMGHEIGYHYEAMDKAKGDYVKAIQVIERELAEFRKIAEVETICMHGNPLTKWDNRDLWTRYSFRDFGLTGEAYLSFSNITYLSDTGRTWDFEHKVKDYLPSASNDSQNTSKVVATTTDDVIGLIKKGQLGCAYLLMHPERWSSNNVDWIKELLRDTGVNLAKRILLLRK